MSEPLNTFITQKIDGKQKASEVLHYQKQFGEFVKQTKYAKEYETSDGWKHLLRPVIERRSSAEDILNVKEITEKKFWDSLQL